jgi:hypothetical protein
MAGAHVDDASAAKKPPHSPRHLPGFEQLFAGQTSRPADGAPNAMKERVVRKAIDVPKRQASAG